MMFLKRIAGAAALTAALLGSSLIASPAQAGYIVKLQQLGTDVIATGIGILDLTGLSPIYEDKTNSIIWPTKGIIATGPAASPATFFLGIG
jgi:hypothetical protein